MTTSVGESIFELKHRTSRKIGKGNFFPLGAALDQTGEVNLYVMQFPLGG